MEWFLLGILLGKRIRAFDSICCLEAPSLQTRSLTTDFSNYIYSNSESIGNVLNVNNISRRRITRLNLAQAFLARVLRFNQTVKEIRAAKSLGLAAKDSLIRKRWCYVYLVSPPILRRAFEYIFVIWGLVLVEEYKRLIRSQQPELVITSHLCYLPFVALAQAAVSLGVPIFHPGDCIDRVAVGESEVFHGFASILEYQGCLGELKDLGSGQDLFFDPKSLYATRKRGLSVSVDTGPKSSSIQKEKKGIVIYTHCFKDANNIFPMSKGLFDNYFDWIVETIFQLTTRHSNYDVIVYKIHPHSPRYEDLTPLRVLGWILKQGLNKDRVVIVDHDKSMDSVLCRYGDVSFTPFSCNGSVFLEMACLGKKCISVGSPACPRSGYHAPRTNRDYRELLLDKAKLEAISEMSEDELKVCRNFASLISYARIPDIFINKWRPRLSEFYYFGRGSSAPDWVTLNEFRESLDNEVESRLFNADTSGGIQFYFSRDVNRPGGRGNAI